MKILFRNNITWGLGLMVVLMVIRETRGGLVVPGLRPSKYIQAGNLNLGVLQQVLKKSPGSEDHCDHNSFKSSALHKCEGSLYAINQINAREDLLPNISLGLVCMDTCANPVTALAQTVYMIEDHATCMTSDNMTANNGGDIDLSQGHHQVEGVIGSGWSRDAVVVSKLLEVFQIPMLGTYETSDELSDKSQHSYFLRLAPPDRFQAEVFIDIILYFNWTYVGVVYSEGSYGEYAARRIEALAKEHDICIAYFQRLTIQTKPNEIDTMLHLMDTHKRATVIVWFVDSDIGQRFLAVFEQMKISDYLFLMSDSSVQMAPDYPNVYRKAVMLDYYTSVTIPGYLDYYRKQTALDDTQDDLLYEETWSKYWMKRAWVSTYGCEWSRGSNNSCQYFESDPSWEKYIVRSAYYYEAVCVYAHALHTLIASECPDAFADPSLLKGCVRGKDLLRTLKNVSIDGVSGHVQFDVNGDRLPTYRILRLDIGNDLASFTPIGTWDKYSQLNTSKVHNIEWHFPLALTLPRFFDTDDISNPTIPSSFCSFECDVKQYKIQLNPHCCWECRWCRSNEILTLNKTTCTSCPDYTWPDEATATECLPIKPDFMKWSDMIAICLMVFSLLGSTLSVLCMAVLWYRRKTRLVKATNKELSFLILVGATLAFLNVFAFVAKPSKAICFIREFGFSLVVNLMYVPLLVKTCRVYLIFEAGKRGMSSPKGTSSRSQRLMTGACICLLLVILFIMKVLTPPDTRLIMPVKTEPYVELTCLLDTLSFLLPLSYNILLILTCSLLGYRTRRLPENFNESGFIFVSVSTTLFAWTVFLPTFFTADSSQNQATILALCLLLNAYITVGCLFGPKVYALFCVDEASITFSAANNSVTQATSTASRVTTHSVM